MTFKAEWNNALAVYNNHTDKEECEQAMLNLFDGFSATKLKFMLSWNDSNGIYNDSDVDREYGKEYRLTKGGCITLIVKILDQSNDEKWGHE